ncbi:MAG: hypothetical protein WBP85_08420, partial [Terracidiphilus sp.]
LHFGYAVLIADDRPYNVIAGADGSEGTEPACGAEAGKCRAGAIVVKHERSSPPFGNGSLSWDTI